VPISSDQPSQAPRPQRLHLPRAFDRDKYETEFHIYFNEQLSKTMGQLAKRVGEFPELSDELKGGITDALEHRNFPNPRLLARKGRNIPVGRRAGEND
jgi:hypothetical protein